MRPATLADYVWLYKNTDYMADGLKCARQVMPDIVELCPASFLDYGGGRGHVAEWINTKTSGRCKTYEPSLGQLFKGQFDYVLSFDVLEHIPKTTVDFTLGDMADATLKGAILTIAHMSDIHKVDGEDVELHVTIRPATWWFDRIAAAYPGAVIQQRKLDSERTAFFITKPFQPEAVI